jgi:saposin
LKTSKQLSPNSAECTLCELILGYLDKTLGTNRSAAAVTAILEKICKVLPASVRANCTTFVDKYGPIIAILVAKNATPVEVCDFLKVCHNGTQQVAPRKYNTEIFFLLITDFFISRAIK